MYKKNYNKLKHYWKLIQKFEDDLDKDNKKYSIYFGKEIAEYDIVSYITNTNKKLRNTYELYQGILKSIRNKDQKLFYNIISSKYKNISEYMNTTLKSCNKFSYHITSSFKYDLSNDIIERINNLIKCIKKLLSDIVVSIISKLELCLFLVFTNVKIVDFHLSFDYSLSLVFGSTNTI